MIKVIFELEKPLSFLFLPLKMATVRVIGTLLMAIQLKVDFYLTSP